MAKKIKRLLGNLDNTLNCACLIHDTLYDFGYVDKLYRALCRNLSPNVRLHVYTESNRDVPSPYVKHDLQEWPGIRGPKQSWWYKIQLFNPDYYAGPLLYFDLDTVIVNNIDWIWQQKTNYFWAARDFKYLFRPRRATINSSVMWFDTTRFSNIYTDFNPKDVVKRIKPWHGDQDYIHEHIPVASLKYLDTTRIRSYKWEIKEGGYNFNTRKHHAPGADTNLNEDTSVLIFHGNPKPHECRDKNVLQHWI